MKGIEKAMIIEDQLDQASNILSAIDTLNDDVPKVRELYDGLKSDIEKGSRIITTEASKQKKIIKETISSFDEHADKRESEIKALTDQGLQQISETVKRAETLMSKVEQYIVRMDQYLEQLSAAEKRMKTVEEKLNKTEKTAKKLSEIIAQKKADEIIEIDYDEVGTIQQIYEKYNGRINGCIIVVKTDKTGKTGWYNDYCFAIEEDAGDKYIGKDFKQGKIHKQNVSRLKTESNFSLYNGPSKQIINDFYANPANEQL